LFGSSAKLRNFNSDPWEICCRRNIKICHRWLLPACGYSAINNPDKMGTTGDYRCMSNEASPGSSKTGFGNHWRLLNSNPFG